MLAKLRACAIGLDARHRLADGRIARRIYLDNAASTLQLGVAKFVLEQYLPHYANTHSGAHFSARISGREFQWAHLQALDFVNADPKTHGCFFVGSGATAGLNRAARTLARKYPDRDTVITTIMEHHSNDLPHRKNFNRVIHTPLQVSPDGLGAADVARMEQALKKHAPRVNYIAVTGVSNVTGIVNPIYDIAELAHNYGALILVDAAQMAAHAPITVSARKGRRRAPERDLDIVCFSGHKLYAPASPGVVVARMKLFAEVAPDEVGGGMVDDVHLDRFSVTKNFADREEAGTPNIAGAIQLAGVLYALQQIGMKTIAAEENELINYAADKLSKLDEVVVYGAAISSEVQRAGAISFNLRDMHHAQVAAVLNDYFNIAVRNACFCAHPYVREMITAELGEHMEDLSNAELEALAELHRGMVRISFGLYNTRAEVDALVAALKQICDRREYFTAQYAQVDAETYAHKTFQFNGEEIFSAQAAAAQWLAAD